ncbi:MAG: hypothetical protein KDD69_04065 [Bdellovibrionales bacterium]|nr:hypothetical protein [Bdellovibrionales bacterium]
MEPVQVARPKGTSTPTPNGAAANQRDNAQPAAQQPTTQPEVDPSAEKDRSERIQRLKNDLNSLLEAHTETLQHYTQSLPEARTALSTALRSFLNQPAASVSVLQTTEGPRLQVLPPNSIDPALATALDFSSGKARFAQPTLVGVEVMIRYGVDVNQDTLWRTHLDGKIVRSAATDPSLGPLVTTYQQLDGTSPGLPMASAVPERTAWAALLSRYLENQELAPTAENMRTAYEAISRHQTAYRDTPLFSPEQRPLVFAHGQTFVSPPDSPNDAAPTVPTALADMKHTDSPYMFGRPMLIRALESQTAPGAVSLFRPEYTPQLYIDTLSVLAGDHVQTVAEWQNGPATTDEQKAFIRDAEQLFRKDGITVSVHDLGAGKGSSLVLNIGDHELGYIVRTPGEEENTIQLGIGHSAYSEEERKASSMAAKNGFLEAVRTSASPGGARIIVDAHGAHEFFASAGGVPITGPDGVTRIESPGIESMVAAKELAEALLDRSKQFPDEPPALLAFASCLSGSYADALLGHLTRLGAPVPIVISATETNELTSANGSSPLGHALFHALLDPDEAYERIRPSAAEMEKLTVEAGFLGYPPQFSLEAAFPRAAATLGTFIDDLKESPRQVPSRPRVIVPGIDGAEVPYVQIE